MSKLEKKVSNSFLKFAQKNGDYYSKVFGLIQKSIKILSY